MMSTPWDTQLADLLSELSTVQGELLDLLNEKRTLLRNSDYHGLAALQTREESLIGKLQACHEHRALLLTRAADDGMPSDSIHSLAQALPRSQRDELGPKVRDASARSRLIQHQSLANWVVVQRTLIHLSQVLEILATGGRLQPTYGEGPGEPPRAGGTLVDQAA